MGSDRWRTGNSDALVGIGLLRGAGHIAGFVGQRALQAWPSGSAATAAPFSRPALG